MVKPKKERFLKEVYNATPIVPLPKVTPVLAGNFRMQGPVDAVDHYNQTNTVRQQGALPVDEGVGRPNNQKLDLRTESRTSKVCAASSLSCLHSKQDPMEKANGFSDKPDRENTLSYSVNDVSTVVMNETCENKQHTTSETGNLGSASSSYNAFRGNAESKVDMRTSDVFCTSEAVEVYPKLSSGEDFRVENYSTIPDCHVSKTDHMNKFNDPRRLEGRDDNISCVYGTDEPSILSNSVTRNSVPSASAESLLTQGCKKVATSQTASESKNFKFDVEGSRYHSSKQSKNNEDSFRRACLSSQSSELSSHHSDLMENHSSGADNGTRLRNTESTSSDAPCGKFLASQSTSKDSVESCSHLHGKLPGRAGDHLGGDVVKSSSLNSDEFGNSKVSISVGNQKEIMTPCQKKEVGTNSDGGHLPEEPSKPAKQSLEGEVRNIPATSDDKETSLQCDHVDNSDESDAVEHDVKVCDICGDAGREDLLAICCRCIDGAEHTYCMREMLDKVPEGDWLCEECKLDEENKNLNQEKYGTEAVAEKDQSSGQADTEPATISIKPDGKRSADVEGEHRTIKDHSAVKVSSKRHAEESEDSSAVKKQALEVIAGSPRTSSPSRLHALTCDSSVKDVDCGKAKPGPQFSSGSHFGTDPPEAARSPATGPRSQASRGAFFKSNSFNIPNARPKTKLVDEVVFQRQKSIKEPASRNTKGVRGIDKSMSFKSTTSGRFGASDSKVKMMSPKFSHVQDLKSPKNKNERIFERKNSFKSPLVGNLTTSSSTASTPKVDKIASRGETVPISSSCNQEVKPLKGDSKLIGGLKSTTRATSIGAEVPVSIGEVNRQLPSSPSGVGNASSNGIISSVEQKRARTAMKDDNSSNVATSKESTNLAEGVEDLRPSITPGTSGVSCQKCEQTSHSAQICTADSLGSCGLDTLAMRSSKEVINRDNKLRDAIEAAMLKKPGIYRKNKISDQSDESSVSSMNNEVTCLDRIPNSNNVGNLNSAEGVIDWQGKASRNCSAGYAKQSNGNDSKQSMMLPAEGIISRIHDTSLVVPSDGKHSTTELSSHDAMALFSPLKIPAIPDHEYIWQGSFEVCRSGKTAQFWDGLQAHLSTCASPRVFEVVNKLPLKILLNGVSRVNAWPVQFENSGTKEDNIALYFFAKDIESYERSYQILLEDMMRDDLALIGSFDDVELLIFPSNQLPEKSHRWNMLFFLWGVFREKKKNSLQQVPGSTEMFCMPRVAPSISTAKMSLPEDVCWSGSIDKERHIDSEFKGDLQTQTSLQETTIDNISTPLDNVNVVPASSGEIVYFGDVTEENVTVSNRRDDSIDVVNCSGNLKVQRGLFPTNGVQCEPRKHPLVDLSEDVTFTGTRQINLWYDVNSPMVDEGSVNKKQKTGLYGRNNYDTSFPGHIFETGSVLKEKRCDLEETAIINPGNSKGERYFFPVDPTCQVKDVVFGESLGSSISNNDHDRLREKVRTPNLELALGAELKPSLNQDFLHLVGNIDRQRIIMKKEEQPPDKLAAIAKEDDDVSASLALSLSFSPAHTYKEDKAVEAFPRAGRLMSGNRHHSSHSMLLFGDIPDK